MFADNAQTDLTFMQIIFDLHGHLVAQSYSLVVNLCCIKLVEKLQA